MLETLTNTSNTTADKELLDRVETIFVVENLYSQQNGIVQSVIRKMKFFEDKWGYKPLLLIAEYNIELFCIHSKLKLGDYKDDQTHLNMGARILGVYDYFQKSYRLNTAETEYAHEEGKTYVQLTPGVFKVYDEDKLIRIEYYTGFGKRLRMIERLDSDGDKMKTIIYDDCGCISKIRLHDKKNQKYHPFEYYYTTDRKLCIKAEYSYDSKLKGSEEFRKNVIKKLTVYDDNGNVERECADNAELVAHCIEKITTDKDKYYLVVDEAGRYTKVPAILNKANILKSTVVHSAFLENANNIKSNPQFYYKYLCENNTKFDGIVFLTQAEKKDFLKLYGDMRNTFVIPHPYPHEIIQADFEARNHKKAVIVSRFDPVKKLDIAIDIFNLVVEQLPDVKLELYGFGREGSKLNEQIKNLNLENNVFVKGFTDDPAEVFRGAAFSIMTSYVEGFGLTLAESICNGCPAFAFDIKYGPSDIIKDGETGYLFPFKDKEAFAEKIVAYFQDIDLQRQFSENCYNDAPRFSKEVFLDKWYAFMETMYRRNR